MWSIFPGARRVGLEPAKYGKAEILTFLLVTFETEEGGKTFFVGDSFERGGEGEG
jgi:hypothetical protein